jgi:hypothetical protein
MPVERCHICWATEGACRSLHAAIRNPDHWCPLLERVLRAADKRHHYMTPRRGRPLKGKTAMTLTARQPWRAEGLSRATWYRRQQQRGFTRFRSDF